ncbi:MAG TPA: glycosyltransferase family 2 protein [Xanthomonadales bacterium]|nr:glycosyltransferase family 2 protein [Xanthomonadales bacterium]
MADSTRVIIINFNAGEALLACVASVLSTREELTAVVADNQSSDKSCEVLRSRFGSSARLQILENAHNLGFGPAVNACAKAAAEPFLLILNPDCELFPDTLLQLRKALAEDSEAALAAPVVVNPQGEPMRGNLRYLPTAWKALMTGTGLYRLASLHPVFTGVEIPAGDYPAESSPAEAVSGACMLVKTEVFRSLGGFDEQFSMHFEDLDLMARIRQAGLHCLLVPQARAIHHAGLSSASRPVWVHRQKHQGLQRYFRKHVFPHSGMLARGLVSSANWLHYLLGLPLVLLRQMRV